MEDLAIGIFSCTIVEKYRTLIRGCCETWVQKCDKVYFFNGESGDLPFQKEMEEITNGKAVFVHLKGVKDDYLSASYKQWLGFGYLYNNVNAKWYALLGTDNYVHHDRVVKKLLHHDHTKDYILGGPGSTIKIDVYIPFLLGGAGVFATKSAIGRLSEYGSSRYVSPDLIKDDYGSYSDLEMGLLRLHIDWENRVHTKEKDFHTSCDVALCYYAWILQIPLIMEPTFLPLSSSNGFNFGARLIISDVSICHYMSREHMHSHEYMSKKLSGGQIYVNSVHEYSKKTGEENFKNFSLIHELSKECTNLAECQSRHIFTTFAFLNLKSNCKIYHLRDTMMSEFPSTQIAAETDGNRMIFLKGDSSKIRLPEPVDMLVIDSLCCYVNILRELNNHEKNVRKYIVIYQSEKYKLEGEPKIKKMDIARLKVKYDCSESDLSKGIKSAWDEFLLRNKNWIVHEERQIFGGVIVFKRVNHPDGSYV
jgi:hypothetical protein